MRTLTFAISALLGVMLGTGAQAHAFLDHAEPRVGSTVPTAPRELSLSFTQKLEPAFSSVEVSDANGARVDLGKRHRRAGFDPRNQSDRQCRSGYCWKRWR